MTTPVTKHDGPAATLASSGGWPFLITSFVARMPSSMVQLGYLMVLSQDGRGMAIGGLAVAAVGLGSAVGAPVVGRLVDRFGPGPILTLATLLSVAAQAGFIVGLTHDRASWQLLASAALVGAANPQVGPVARSHWSHLAVRLRAPHLVGRALGYEGMVDEIGFVVGPVLASILVTALGPSSAALVILALTFLLQGVFLVHLWRDRASWPVAGDSRVHGRDHGRAGWRVVWPMLACLSVGIVFGATQTGLTALFTLRQMPSATGLVYGFVGVGSAVASLLVGRLPERFPIPARIATGGLFVLLGALAFLSLPGAVIACAIAALLGSGAGMTLVSAFSWMERIAPKQRMATWMTVLATCITLGVSSGAAVGGRLADNPAHVFALDFVSGALALLAAAAMWFTRTNRTSLAGTHG